MHIINISSFVVSVLMGGAITYYLNSKKKLNMLLVYVICAIAGIIYGLLRIYIPYLIIISVFGVVAYYIMTLASKSK